MKRQLVLCDHSEVPTTLESEDFDLLRVQQHPPAANLRLQITNLSHRLLTSLTPIARDLIEVATYVYHADNSVRRGTLRDVFNKMWVRDFTFVIPVRALDIWESEPVRSLLVEMLTYLTEDRFEFVFVPRQAQPEQMTFQQIKNDLPFAPDADCVALFSGGMDSMAGAVNLVATGRKPVLASHLSRPAIANLQRGLAEALRERFPSWPFPHLDLWVNRMQVEAVENSQRSRSFLFLAIASAIADELGLHELVVSENGITTFNLPRVGQTVGTQATRSTHPRVLDLFRQLASELLGREFTIANPFLWFTRADTITYLIENDWIDLLPHSASCNHSRRPREKPHCGTCSQCVDRRFAVAYTQLDDLEGELNGYEKDIFTDELEPGVQTIQAMSPVNFSRKILESDESSFLIEYGEVFDALDCLPGEAEQVARDVYALHVRYADQVYSVLREQHGKNWARMYDRELPKSCLLMLTSPAAPHPQDGHLAARADELMQSLRDCPFSKNVPFEDVCEDVLSFLFCEYLPQGRALEKPLAQSATDEGRRRRDLLFQNRASEGFWAEARTAYDAIGVVFDAKNYNNKIDGGVVRDFAKYLHEKGVGRFGVIVAREVPADISEPTSVQQRVSSAVDDQKNLWHEDGKMIVLLSENDLTEMLQAKVRGVDPTSVISDKIWTLRRRI